MSHELNDEQVSTFKEVFTLFEKEDEGSISSKELGTVLRLLGMKLTNGETKGIIDRIDTDNNGKIEFVEFLSMMDRRMKKSQMEDEVYKVFCYIIQLFCFNFYQLLLMYRKIFQDFKE